MFDAAVKKPPAAKLKATPMTWLWLTIAVIAAIGLLIVGIGSLLPREHRVSCTITLRTAQSAVWAAITDWRALPSWRNDLTAIELLKDSNEWVEISKFGRVSMRIERSEAEQLFVTRITDESLPFGGTWTWQLSALPDGSTRVTTIEDGFIRAPAFRFFSKFVFGHHSTICRAQLALAAKFGELAQPIAN
ncbi:MAG: SRPBCC family protein [Planctomycetota bacterium]|nr:SRPBCC family protein [Planctomycetota bacterium]